jgi:3-oxoacyl-[acyl-carrier protein] reductase
MNITALNGTVALVTGASSGIGDATARRLAEHGASVVVVARRKDRLDTLVSEIEAAGGTALAVETDITDRDQADRAVQSAIDRFGRLDILINNAADQISRVDIADVPDELFERHVDVNIRPIFTACRAAVRQFRRQEGGRGNIINVSSIAARTGGGGGSYIYAGAKGFVSTFSRSLAKEVAPQGIRVNVVAPGVIATDMQDRVTSPEQLRAVATQIPMRRIGEPGDCTGAFLYLCSDELSGYVTGQVIEVNGGLLMP